MHVPGVAMSGSKMTTVQRHVALAQKLVVTGKYRPHFAELQGKVWIIVFFLPSGTLMHGVADTKRTAPG